MSKKEGRWKNPKPKTETPTPTPERGNGKKREGQEKKKEDTPAPLSPFAKRDALSASGSGGFDRLYARKRDGPR